MSSLMELNLIENISKLRTHVDKRVMSSAKKLRKKWKSMHVGKETETIDSVKTKKEKNDNDNDVSKTKKKKKNTKVDSIKKKPTLSVMDQLKEWSELLKDGDDSTLSLKFEALSELSSMKITQDQLIESKIGMYVSKLRKSRYVYQYYRHGLI